MPRDNRGGARNGKAGASYPNRTDLNGAPKALPITAAPGQPYGEAGAQRASQTIAPMASGPLPTAPVAPNTPPALAGAAPGSLPDIFAPHNGPQQFNGGQPVTAPTPMPSQPTIAALGLLKTLPENLLSPQNKMIIQYLEKSAANGATY